MFLNTVKISKLYNIWCRSSTNLHWFPATKLNIKCSYSYTEYRARICKRLRSPKIDSKESIPPSYVAWRFGTSNKVAVPARRLGISIPGLLKRFTNSDSEEHIHFFYTWRHGSRLQTGSPRYRCPPPPPIYHCHQ
jgi:hypothetical protein